VHYWKKGPHEAGAESTPTYGNALIKGPCQHATNFLTDEIIHKITREINFKIKKQNIEPFGKNRRYLTKILMRLTTKLQA
jgi:hypothetical protein